MSEKLVFEQRDNKVVIKVTVNPAPDSDNRKQYIACAVGAPLLWSKGDSIEAAVEKFQNEYGSLMRLRFANGEQIEFDFSVKLTL